MLRAAQRVFSLYQLLILVSMSGQPAASQPAASSSQTRRRGCSTLAAEDRGHVNLAMEEMETTGAASPQASTEGVETNGAASPQASTGKKPSSKLGSIVSYHNINYTLRQRNIWCKIKTKGVLKDLNGIMAPGLNAILGPSGSGKSSFLDVLAARKNPSGLSGEVLIDGAPQPPNFKCLCGYVVQDDVVMSTLTVRENLRFSGALRLHSSVPQKEKEARVNKLIEELGLTGVADSRVGTQEDRGISGGERKRTSIGMEMIIDPAILFLDEPTTGLDAATSYSVMLLLKRMAKRDNKNIIMSIHQPRFSIYNLFDTLTMLAYGQMMYQGMRENAVEYFKDMGYVCEGNDNPADFFLDVISGSFKAIKEMQQSEELNFETFSNSKKKEVDQSLVDYYQGSMGFTETQSKLGDIVKKKQTTSRPLFRSITYNTSFCNQLGWVLKRNVKNLILDREALLYQFGLNLIIAIALGIVFFGVKDNQAGIQNRSGVLFFIAVNMCFSSTNAAQLFIAEKKLFVHEFISGYYPVLVYFIAKVLCYVAVRTVMCVIFCCIVYFMIGLKFTAEAFGIFLLTVILVAFTATALSVAASTQVDNYSTAHMLSTVCFILMMLFSGLLANQNSIMFGVHFLKFISIPRYGLAALQINEFVGLNFCEGVQNRSGDALAAAANLTDCGAAVLCTGEQNLDYLGVKYTDWALWENHVALSVMTVVLLIIAFIGLYRSKKYT